jgi:HTH-type transcriptional regulator / antitoxin HipB
MNNNNHLTKILEDIPEEFLLLQIEKKKIADIVRDRLKERKLTFREAAEGIEDFSYTQLSRVTSCGNYTIETLLKTLNGLDLKLEIKKKDE